MQDDKIKEAFAKIKEEMDYLFYELNELKRTITEIKENQTEILKNQTDNRHSTDSSTIDLPLEAVKSSNNKVSSGNDGVSTDRQTDQQTDRQPLYFVWKNEEIVNNSHQNNINSIEKEDKKQKTQILTQLHRASEILDSLDDLRKEVRIKFKKLTSQEMQVFAAIYELEEKGFIVDYTLLAENLNLTESSIRDYILRLIKKGIPVDKTRENNKRIKLSISKDLRKVASLETINQLREI